MNQWPRSDDEETKFRAALTSLQYLYAHQHTWVWCLKLLPAFVEHQYNARGWPHFEQSISAWVKDRSKRLDLSLLTVDPALVTDFYTEVEQVCVSTRPQPVTPARFRDELEQKHFTNGTDMEVVVGLYNDAFEDVMSSVQELDFRGLGWSNIDLLIEALEFAQPKQLRRISESRPSSNTQCFTLRLCGVSIAEASAGLARDFLLAVLHGNTVLSQQKARLLAALPEGALVGVDDMDQV
jgi:hypothetical protein|eukprot:4465777-Prymnesium_polylepis.2